MLDSILLAYGIDIESSRVKDFDKDGTPDLQINFTNGGGSATLLGVDSLDDVMIQSMNSASNFVGGRFDTPLSPHVDLMDTANTAHAY